jgi:hypothetical protein
MSEERMPFAGHVRQILRWLVAIKAATPVDYNFILLTNTTFLSFLFWLTAPTHPFPIAVLAGTVVFRIVTPFYLHWRILNDLQAAWHAWLVLPVDFLLPVLWLIGQWRRRVSWRGTDFILRKGTLVPVKNSGK